MSNHSYLQSQSQMPASRTSAIPMSKGVRQSRSAWPLIMQGRIGKGALQRLHQARLEVSCPDDPSEQQSANRLCRPGGGVRFRGMGWNR